MFRQAAMVLQRMSLAIRRSSWPNVAAAAASSSRPMPSGRLPGAPPEPLKLVARNWASALPCSLRLRSRDPRTRGRRSSGGP